MKTAKKPGCNQKNLERDDVTALLPMRNEQKLHRYIFFEGKGAEEAVFKQKDSSNAQRPGLQGFDYAIRFLGPSYGMAHGRGLVQPSLFPSQSAS